jgi:hypothetical protein
MGESNFYNETKWCDSCGKYVHYLLSLDHSFCVECGGKVRLYSETDWQQLNEELAARRPKGGRPKKRA